MCANVEHSHTCEHLLVAVKLPGSFPRDAEIPWDDDEILRSLRRGVDTDVVVAEVRFVWSCASLGGCLLTLPTGRRVGSPMRYMG
jgi:hypothetical protein